MLCETQSQLTEQYNCVNGSVELVEMCLWNGIDRHSLFHYLHFAFIVTVYICLSVCCHAGRGARAPWSLRMHANFAAVQTMAVLLLPRTVAWR